MNITRLSTYKPNSHIDFQSINNTTSNCNRLHCDTFTLQTSKIKHKNSLLSFTGITQQLAKTLYETHFTLEIINKEKKAKGKYGDIAGNLPDSWIKSIDSNSRNNEKTIKKLYREFGKATLELQEPLKGISLSMENLTAFDIKIIYGTDIHIQIPMVRTYQRSVANGMKKAENILTKALQQANVISNKDKINLQLIDVGKIGTAYKFNVNDKEYVFKAFHPFFDDQYPNPYHGRAIEINRAAFINKITKSIKDHNYNKFYFGDIAKGYMVTDFLPSDKTNPSKKLNDEAYGFEFKDNNGNRNEINGTRYDMGGILINNKLLLDNKTMQWTFNQIMKDDIEGEDNTQQRLKNWHELFLIAFENKKPNCKDIMRALIDFICLLPKEEQIYMAQEFARNKFIDDDNKLAFSHYFVPKHEGKRLPIPMDEIKHIYADLVKNADGVVKEQLINQIVDFPYAHQIDFFEMFAYDSKDNETRLILKQLIKKLPKEDQQKGKTTLKRASN